MDDLSPGGTKPLRTLDPFTIEECVSIKEAATIAGRTERTLRNWGEVYGIGRRIAGRWAISRIALMMLLNGDLDELKAYRDDGARAWPPVAKIYHRYGLGHLLERPEFGGRGNSGNLGNPV